MKFEQLKNAFLIVPHPGANLTVTDSDGVVIAQVGFPGGIHRLADIRNWFKRGDEFMPENGAVFAERRGERVTVIRSPEATSTGANLEFQPTRMTAFERTMYATVKNLQRKVKMQDKRAQAVVKPKAEPDPLIEPETAPDPAPEPGKGKPEAEPVAAE